DDEAAFDQWCEDARQTIRAHTAMARYELGERQDDLQRALREIVALRTRALRAQLGELYQERDELDAHLRRQDQRLEALRQRLGVTQHDEADSFIADWEHEGERQNEAQ